MFDLSLLGVVIIGSILLFTLSGFIALLVKSFGFVEFTHWASLLLLPLLILYGLCMIFLWTDQTHTETKTDDDGTTETVTVTGLTKPVLCILIAVQIGLQVTTMIMNLTLPYDDMRKNATFKWTYFSCSLLLLLATLASAVFCALVLKEVPLLLTGIDGWSVYMAAAAGFILAGFMVAALARPVKTLRVVLWAMALLSIPWIVASVINYYLSYEVPLDSSGSTGVSANLLYASIITIASTPFTALSWGTGLLWKRRRVKTNPNSVY